MNEIIVAENSLVSIIDGKPMTTSLAIAQGTENEHASVLALIRKYLPDFETFGGVRFEIEPFETNGGIQQREYAILNERQSTLVLSYMRNSEIIRAFKIRLVSEFYRMAEQQRPLSLAQIALVNAQALVKLEEEQRQLALRQEATERRLDQIETATDHFTIIGWWRYAKQSGSLAIAEAAKFGRQATLYCKDHEVPMGEVPDPRFGVVKTYPKWVLDELFAAAH